MNIERVIIIYSIALLLVFAVYVGTTAYIIVNSKKYNNVNAALWVVLNLLFSPVGFIGYLVARREKTSN